MKKIVTGVIVVFIGSCIASLSSISAFAIYKRNYERPYAVWTYSAASAPDQPSITSDVTLPEDADNKLQFYCYQYSSNKSVKNWATNSSVVSSNNAAYLSNQFASAYIPLYSNWIDYNNSSRILGFSASLVNAVESDNDYIACVAY